MTIHWKTLEDHFLIGTIGFSIQPFSWGNAFFSKKFLKEFKGEQDAELSLKHIRKVMFKRELNEFC
jgi:hypothetical protein